MNAATVCIAPSDRRRPNWAKRIALGTPLPLPSSLSSAEHVPGAYLRRGEHLLMPGDFMVQGEAQHHSKARGWHFWIQYLGIDGRVHHVTPTAHEKAAMKRAGMSKEWLQGAGPHAACIRLIQALRLHLDVDLVPLGVAGAPVTPQEFAEMRAQLEIWDPHEGADQNPHAWRTVIAHVLTRRAVVAFVEARPLETPLEFVFRD